MKLGECIKEFIYRDVTSESETKRAAVILRYTTIIMCCYFFLTMLAYIVSRNWELLLFAFPCIFFYGRLFCLTYQGKTSQLVLYVNIVTIFVVLYMIYVLGWDCGVQHFIFALIVLNFTMSTKGTRRKILGAIALSLLRIALYIFALNNSPVMVLTIELKIVLQVFNTTTICAIIISSLLLYTKDSRVMEEKLIVYNEKLQRLASMDPLTGLWNRRYVLEYMEEKSKRYVEGRYNAISIAIADIDYFKKINDVYGHECGDIVLKRISQLFDEYMKELGIIGRWGGEEFLFVFVNQNGDQAYNHLMNLERFVKRMELEYGDHKFVISLTYGLTEYDSNKTIEGIIKEADTKLYMGKQAGRNRIVY